jgi:hypothetical protein
MKIEDQLAVPAQERNSIIKSFNAKAPHKLLNEEDFPVLQIERPSTPPSPSNDNLSMSRKWSWEAPHSLPFTVPKDLGIAKKAISKSKGPQMKKVEIVFVDPSRPVTRARYTRKFTVVNDKRGPGSDSLLWHQFVPLAGSAPAVN